MVQAMSTREDWLVKAVKALEAGVFQNKNLVGDNKMSMPEKWAVTCGWCKGSSKYAQGVCVDPKCSKDGTTHLFIVPVQDQVMSILGTLLHEMVHAIVGVKEGHKRPFRECCKLIGLMGKVTSATIAKGTPTWTICEQIALQLGPYPHAAMVPHAKPTRPSPWVRWRSTTWPKYTILANTKHVIQYGVPRDPRGNEMIPVDPKKVFGIHHDPRQERLPGTD